MRKSAGTSLIYSLERITKLELINRSSENYKLLADLETNFYPNNIPDNSIISTHLNPTEDNLKKSKITSLIIK